MQRPTSTDDSTILPYLSKEAQVRYNRIGMYNREHAHRIRNELLRLIRGNRIVRPINEDEFEELAMSMGGDRDVRIEMVRRRNCGDM